MHTFALRSVLLGLVLSAGAGAQSPCVDWTPGFQAPGIDGTVRPLAYGVCFWALLTCTVGWTLVQRQER